MPTEAQQFSTRLLDQLKANGHPTSATYLARQFNVTPHAARYVAERRIHSKRTEHASLGKVAQG
jgi:hypothetical protein